MKPKKKPPPKKKKTEAAEHHPIEQPTRHLLHLVALESDVLVTALLEGRCPDYDREKLKLLTLYTLSTFRRW